MSKIGQKLISLPENVTVTIAKKQITIKGPEGEMQFRVPPGIHLEKNESGVILKTQSEEKKIKSIHGLYRQLIYNAVTGVVKPWEKRLEVVGTGFNVKSQGEDLMFKLGFSHPIVFKKVDGIRFKVEGNTKVIVSGIDKQLVGQVAYQIKLLRKPDAYKGKGIRYEGEILRIKPGKKAKVAGAVA